LDINVEISNYIANVLKIELVAQTSNEVFVMNKILFRSSATALLLVVTHAHAESLVPNQFPGINIPGESSKVDFAPLTPDSISTGLSQNNIIQSLTGISKNTKTLTRGAKEASIFREMSPAVVLIVTDDGLGSGSYIGNGQILTNWHVVKGFKKVGVAFKPDDGRSIDKDDFIIGDVTKRDEIKDLALVKISYAPENLNPIDISESDDFEVGSDVHAIGHPHGYAWSYTKGLISQYRQNHTWEISKSSKHQADVIQTQTPINGGNSGGPLLSDDGKIIGVNSYKEQGDGLNFAVAAPSIRSFLAAKGNVVALNDQKNEDQSDKPAVNKCKPSVVFEGRNQKNDANIKQVSLNCDKWADITFVAPDDQKRPFMAFIDTQKKQKPEAIVYDDSRSWKWEVSYWDPKLDGTFPLIGFHKNGDLIPTSYIKRCKTGVASTNGKCD
jgi:S1-C subfamily serine protease